MDYKVSIQGIARSNCGTGKDTFSAGLRGTQDKNSRRSHRIGPCAYDLIMSSFAIAELHHADHERKNVA